MHQQIVLTRMQVLSAQGESVRCPHVVARRSRRRVV